MSESNSDEIKKWKRQKIASVKDLTENEIRFIELFATRGGRTTCVALAYPRLSGCTDAELHDFGRGLVQNPVIKKLIEEYKEDKKMLDALRPGIKTKEEMIARLVKIAEKAEERERYSDCINALKTINSMEGWNEPRRVEINQRSINLSFGGWNPNEGLPPKIEEEKPLLTSSTQFEEIEQPEPEKKDVEQEKDNE